MALLVGKFQTKMNTVKRTHSEHFCVDERKKFCYVFSDWFGYFQPNRFDQNSSHFCNIFPQMNEMRKLEILNNFSLIPVIKAKYVSYLPHCFFLSNEFLVFDLFDLFIICGQLKKKRKKNYCMY